MEKGFYKRNHIITCFNWPGDQVLFSVLACRNSRPVAVKMFIFVIVYTGNINKQQIINSYDQRSYTKCDISETALLITISNFRKYFSIQTHCAQFKRGPKIFRKGTQRGPDFEPKGDLKGTKRGPKKGTQNSGCSKNPKEFRSWNFKDIEYRWRKTYVCFLLSFKQTDINLISIF